jgi:hypothetical protein
MVYAPKKGRPAVPLPVFGHGGSDGTLALVFPEQDLIVCYFTQSRGGMSVFRFEELLAPLVGLKRPAQRHRLTNEQLKPLLGDYIEKSTGKRAWVTKHRNRLRLELAGQGALLPLWPDDRGRWGFGESSPEVSASFDKDSSGAVSKLRLLHQDNPLITFDRVTDISGLPSVEQLMAFRREKQGGDRIDGLKSIEAKGTLNVGATKMAVNVLAAGTNRVIRRVDAPAGVVTTICDGKRATRQAASSPSEFEHGVKLDEARRMSPLARLRDWRESSPAVRVAGQGRIDGEDVWIVRVDCEFEPPLTRYVSKKFGLLKKEVAWITGSGIGTVPITIMFDDYREIAGVMLPFKSTSESALTGKQVLQVEEVRANPEVIDATFAVPER